MAGQKRSKTRYTGVYFNENTKKYDIKYNYTVYNPLKQKNEYKSKWVYNIGSIAEARQKLATLRAGGVKAEDKEITLQGAYDLWEQMIVATKDGSPVTIRNTQQHMRMISQFIPLETKMKDISEDVYLKFCADIRKHKYSDETLRSLNATMRKLINLCYKKRLINENILSYVDNMRTQTKDDYKIMTKAEFDKLDDYFATHSFKRLGVDNYPLYRLIINVLYYCGIRCGELLALTPEDFDMETGKLRVTKSYVSDIQLVKSPKNFKKRSVPMVRRVMELAEPIISDKKAGKRVFEFSHGAVSQMLTSACKKAGIEVYNCHSFRHTFISNLIRGGVPLPVIENVSGDTQETILKRYSHMFADDDSMVLDVMNNL